MATVAGAGSLCGRSHVLHVPCTDAWLQVSDKATAALRTFNEAILYDDRVSLSIVPVGDGIALCRKRPH